MKSTDLWQLTLTITVMKIISSAITFSTEVEKDTQRPKAAH